MDMQGMVANAPNHKGVQHPKLVMAGKMQDMQQRTMHSVIAC